MRKAIAAAVILIVVLELSGCASTTRATLYNGDGTVSKTMELRTPFLSSGSAELDGNRISKKSGAPEKVSVVNLDATMPFTATVDPAMLQQ